MEGYIYGKTLLLQGGYYMFLEILNDLFLIRMGMTIIPC